MIEEAIREVLQGEQPTEADDDAAIEQFLSRGYHE
jgi:hypothetical protein